MELSAEHWVVAAAALTVATHTTTGKHCMRYFSNEHLFDEAVDYVVDF